MTEGNSKERDVNLAMHKSRVCMPEVVPDGVTKSLSRKAFATLSTASETQSHVTKNGATDEGFLKNVSNCEGQDFIHHLWVSGINRNDQMKASETEPVPVGSSDCSGSDVSVAQQSLDCERNMKITCQDLAWLNVNSNGRTYSNVSNLEKDSKPEVEQSDKQRNVKQLNIGQTSFEPVGLSLSSSGVALYMMVNSEDREKLLGSSKTPSSSTPRKYCGKKVTISPTAKGRDDDHSSDVNATTSWIDVSNATESRNVPSHKGSKSIVIQASRIGFNHQEDHNQQAEASNRLPTGCKKSKDRKMCNCEEVKLHPPCHSRTSGTLSNKERRGSETQTMLIGPDWPINGNDIDASNNDDNTEVFSHREERVDHGHIRFCDDSEDKYRKLHSHNSGTRHSEHCAETIRERRPKRHHSRYTSSPTDFCESNNGTSSSDDDTEDVPSRDDPCTKSTNEMNTTRKMKHASQGKKYKPANEKTTHQLSNMTGHSHAVNQHVAEDITSTTVPASHLNPSNVDAVTLEQFIEYAENIRKNIKQDYKNFSTLIKSFTNAVQEKHSNQSSLSNSQFNQLEKPQKEGDRCSVM